MWCREVSANAVNTPIPSNSHQVIPSPAPDHFKRLSCPVPTQSENLFPFAQPFPPVAIRTRFKQVIARRDDMPPPIAADLRPCADGSAVRTALVAWPRRCALIAKFHYTDTDTDPTGPARTFFCGETPLGPCGSGLVRVVEFSSYSTRCADFVRVRSVSGPCSGI